MTTILLQSDNEIVNETELVNIVAEQKWIFIDR